MGQIVIEIPTKARRRYVVSEKSRVAELISALDASATRIKNEPAKLTRQQLEDLQDLEDIRASEEAMEEFRRTGISYSWQEIKAENGL